MLFHIDFKQRKLLNYDTKIIFDVLGAMMMNYFPILRNKL